MNDIKRTSLFRSVVYHKLIERRMDGSAGGAFGALLETVVKDKYYFSGPIYDKNLHVHHIVTNDPERIISLSGRKLTESNCDIVFSEIKDLLANGESALFSGTPCQISKLYNYLGFDYDNLITIDTYCTGVYKDSLIDKYVNEIQTDFGEHVVEIRFNNKEFINNDGKRISLANGKTIFTQKTEAFDEATNKGLFLKDKCINCPFASLSERVADISIGAYDCKNKIGDKLGYTILSVNSEKGKFLYEKSLKRLVLYLENDKIKDSLITIKPHTHKINIDGDFIKNHSFKECDLSWQPKGFLHFICELKRFRRLLLHIKKISQLHPIPLYKFIKYNFFTKGIHSSYENEAFIFFAPYSEISFDKGAELELHGPLEVGVKRVPTSRLETRIWMQPKSKLIVRDRCLFGYGSNIEIYTNAILDVGSLFSNAPITIICGGSIKLGNTVNIAKDCTVRDTNGHLVATQGFRQLRPVDIGNHTWIASGSTIMPGVKIGDGCIVGSCSYVNRSTKPFTISQGNPAIEQGPVKYFRI